MANTELITTQTVGGNQDFGPFAIEYIDITDIKVSLDGVLQTLTTEYTIDSATSTVTFVTAPDVGAVIRIFRETPVENAKAILYPGSSIRAQNVNDNTEQALFAIQEIKDQYVTRSSGEFDTDVDLNSHRLTNVGDPVDQQDAVTKQYLEDNYFDDDTETIQSGKLGPIMTRLLPLLRPLMIVSMPRLIAPLLGTLVPTVLVLPLRMMATGLLLLVLGLVLLISIE